MYRWYRYYGQLAPWGSGYTATRWQYYKGLRPHESAMYFDNYYEIYNNDVLRTSGAFPAWSYSRTYDTNIKKLGTGSYRIPPEWWEDMNFAFGISLPILAGDWLSFWCWANDDMWGKYFNLSPLRSDWFPYNTLYFVEPPPEPPSFSPIWTKQIGAL